MATKPKVIIRRPIAVLNMPNEITLKILKANTILKKIQGSSWFPVPFPSNVPAIAVVQANITALENAEKTAVLNRSEAATDARNVALNLVLYNLRMLMAYVQSISEIPENADNSETIIDAAGFDVKTVTHYNKPPLKVKPIISGMVQLIAKATPGRVANEWGMSSDGGNTWTSFPATVCANTVVSGLVRGAIVLFRHRANANQGPGEWDVISFVIN
jgi:hypothetical protein